MNPKSTGKSKVCFPAADVRYASETLIAVSGQTEAIIGLYVNKGQLSIGALQHVHMSVDAVIDALHLAELALEQDELPF